MKTRNNYSKTGENMSKTKKKTPASVVWFNIPADDLKRAQKFYSALFGWKIKPFLGMKDFLEIETGGAEASPNGGLAGRKCSEEPIINYISVDSVDKFSAKIEKLGGKICLPKTAVPKMGYFAVCQDTENNGFGIWETDQNAK
jgi:predicted enzyme related to lactoylglutathione lyase